MRTTPYQAVLQGAAQMIGLDVTRDLTPSRAASLTQYINNRVKEGWEYDWFPEFTVREKRAFAPVYAAANTYAWSNTVLFYVPNGNPAYFQALTNVPANQPPTDALGNVNLAYWARCQADYFGAAAWQPDAQQNVGDQVLDATTGNYYQCITANLTGATINYNYYGQLLPLNKVVGYAQTFPALVGTRQPNGMATPLGRVKTVSLRDPFIATRNPGYIPFRMSQNGAQVNLEAPPMVWVQFALQEPVFTTVPWSSALAYTGAGELVYVSSPLTGAPAGQCYGSIAAGTNAPPASNPAKWALVGFPLVLSNFVKRAATADMLRDLKQTDRAKIEEDRAYEELANAVDRNIQAQSGSEMAQVETYGSGCSAETFFAR